MDLGDSRFRIHLIKKDRSSVELAELDRRLDLPNAIKLLLLLRPANSHLHPADHQQTSRPRPVCLDETTNRLNRGKLQTKKREQKLKTSSTQTSLADSTTRKTNPPINSHTMSQEENPYQRPAPNVMSRYLYGSTDEDAWRQQQEERRSRSQDRQAEANSGGGHQSPYSDHEALRPGTQRIRTREIERGVRIRNSASASGGGRAALSHRDMLHSQNERLVHEKHELGQLNVRLDELLEAVKTRKSQNDLLEEALRRRKDEVGDFDIYVRGGWDDFANFEKFRFKTAIKANRRHAVQQKRADKC